VRCAVQILNGTPVGTTQVNLGTAYPTGYRTQRSMGIAFVIFTVDEKLFTFSCCVVYDIM
jgi:hypothetical protein